MREVNGLITGSDEDCRDWNMCVAWRQIQFNNTVIWLGWGIAFYRQGLTKDVTFDLGLNKRKGPTRHKTEEASEW